MTRIPNFTKICSLSPATFMTAGSYTPGRLPLAGSRRNTGLAPSVRAAFISKGKQKVRVTESNDGCGSVYCAEVGYHTGHHSRATSPVPNVMTHSQSERFAAENIRNYRLIPFFLLHSPVPRNAKILTLFLKLKSDS
jgi:hypothetical protein